MPSKQGHLKPASISPAWKGTKSAKTPRVINFCKEVKAAVPFGSIMDVLLKNGYSLTGDEIVSYDISLTGDELNIDSKSVKYLRCKTFVIKHKGYKIIETGDRLFFESIAKTLGTAYALHLMRRVFCNPFYTCQEKSRFPAPGSTSAFSFLAKLFGNC